MLFKEVCTISAKKYVSKICILHSLIDIYGSCNCHTLRRQVLALEVQATILIIKNYNLHCNEKNRS